MNAGAVPGVSVSLQELLALRMWPESGRMPRLMQAAMFPGRHAVPQRTRGIEFAELRQYQPGDDIRSIDWRHTAKRGRPYTRLFQQEHERPVRLLVDMGPSMRFGTRVAYKSVAAARAAARLAWQAVAMGDRVGGQAWGVEGAHDIRPASRHHAALALLRQLATASQSPPVASALTEVLRRIRPTLLPATKVLLLSDFSTLDEIGEREIVALSLQAEVVLIHVYDIFEQDPLPGRYLLSAGGATRSLDLTDAAIRAAHVADFAAREARLVRLAQRMRTPLLSLATHDDPGLQLGWMSAAAPASAPAVFAAR